MKKKILAAIALVLLITPPFLADAARTDKESYKITVKIQSYVEQSQWEKALKQSETLEKWYQKNKWRLQLVGDEGEYEGIKRNIRKLQSAISQKDMTQSKILLSDLKSLLEEIYSF